MEKYFCNYNQSLALKELGFEEPGFAGYRDSEWIGTDGPNSRYFHAQLFSNHQFDNDQKEYCSAPLKSQVFEWFREKHGLWVSFGYDEDESEELYWYVDKILECGIGRLFFHDLIEYYTYEEAESACIDKLIELLQHDK